MQSYLDFEKPVADLEGKIALIIGAKGGLGTSVSRAFLAAGASVAGVSRSIRSADFADAHFTAVPGDIASGDAARFRNRP